MKETNLVSPRSVSSHLNTLEALGFHLCSKCCSMRKFSHVDALSKVYETHKSGLCTKHF